MIATADVTNTLWILGCIMAVYEVSRIINGIEGKETRHRRGAKLDRSLPQTIKGMTPNLQPIAPGTKHFDTAL